MLKSEFGVLQLLQTVLSNLELMRIVTCVLALLGTESSILKFYPTATNLQCEVVVPCQRRQTRSIERILAHVQQFKVLRVRKHGGPRGHIRCHFHTTAAPHDESAQQLRVVDPVHESHHSFHAEGVLGHFEKTARFEERQRARQHCSLRKAPKQVREVELLGVGRERSERDGVQFHHDTRIRVPIGENSLGELRLEGVRCHWRIP